MAEDFIARELAAFNQKFGYDKKVTTPAIATKPPMAPPLLPMKAATGYLELSLGSESSQSSESESSMSSTSESEEEPVQLDIRNIAVQHAPAPVQAPSRNVGFWKSNIGKF
jgi:hypothetical protein